MMETLQLEKIYFEYANRIHRYLKNRTGSDELAFDLMQETFLAADRYYSAEKVENIEAWLVGIARNQLKGAMLAQSRRSEQSLDGNEVASGGDTGDQVEYAVLRRRITARLREKKPVLAEIFELRVDLSMTHAQIAESLKMPLITVRRHFEKVRAVIEQEFGEELRGGSHGES